MDFNSFSRSLKKGAPSGSLYLFAGEENFLKEEALQLLRGKILGEEGKEHSVLRIPGNEEGDWGRIFGELNSPPLLSPFKIIVVERGEEVLKSCREDFTRALQRKAPGIVVVIFLKKEDPSWLSSLGKEGGIVVACKKPYEKPPPWVKKAPHEGPLASWVVKRTRDLGGKLSRENAYFLVQRIGTDMAELDREIVKLIHFTGSGKWIAKEDISAATKSRRRYSRFDLTEALAQRKADQCIRVLVSFREEGIEERGKVLHDESRMASMLLNWMERKWRELLEGRRLLDEGRNAEELREKMGFPSFLLNQKLAEFHSYSTDELMAKYPLFLNADGKLKGGDIPPSIVLESLVLGLCTRGKVRCR